MTFLGSDICFNLLLKFLDVADHFCIPLARENTVMPCCCLDFLGIGIDSVSMCFRLSDAKLTRIKE